MMEEGWIMTKQKGDTVSSLPARFRQIYYIPFGNCEWIRTLLGGPNPHEYSESLAMPNKVSQPDCGVKDAAHEVALNSYQKVVKANGEYAIMEHVK